MLLTVDYRTHYHFTAPQERVMQLLRVTPPSTDGQAVLEWSVETDCDSVIRPMIDGYGNPAAMLYVTGPLSEMTIGVTGLVQTEDTAGLVAGAPEPLPTTVFLRDTRLTHASAAMIDFAHGLERMEEAALGTLHLLNRSLNERFEFQPGVTDATTDAASAFDAHTGVCQDYAHIFSSVARLLGHPARYVSGHLFRRDGLERQPAAHAWAEVWVLGHGWIGFDPANGICPDDAYIRVAVGLDYADAAPAVGSRKGAGEESLEVDVVVREAQAQQQQ